MGTVSWPGHARVRSPRERVTNPVARLSRRHRPVHVADVRLYHRSAGFRVRAHLQRWLRTNHAALLRERRQALDASPLPALLALLHSPDDEAARLRQSSPFAGLRKPEERRSAQPALGERYRRSQALLPASPATGTGPLTQDTVPRPTGANKAHQAHNPRIVAWQ